MTKYLSLGEYLQKIKHKKHGSIREFAKVAGISRNYLHYIKNGVEPSPEVGKRISRLTGGEVRFRSICPEFHKKIIDLADDHLSFEEILK